MKRTLLAAAFMLSSVAVATASSNTDGAAANYTESQWEHYAAAEYAGGTGTEADPYLIATPEQFMKLAVEVQNIAADDNNWGEDYSKGKYWKQTADLVFNEGVMSRVKFASGDASTVDNAGLRTFTGVGYLVDEYDYQVFAGTYDGDGHSISGLYMNTSTNKSTGLFNNAWGATIKNLTVKDAYISGNASVGIIAGTVEKNTLIINCQTSGIIYCGGSYHAGIAGNISESKVLNCATDAWTWAKNNVGGIIGRGAYSSEVSNCFYNGWLGAVYSNVGKMQYWGAVAPELGKAENTTSTENPDDPENPTVVCENPSTAQNCYWTDTCTVRHKAGGVVEAVNAANSTYGKVVNCNAVGTDKIAETVAALNENAKSIAGACGWKVGEGNKPELVFGGGTSGIGGVTTGAEGAKACSVYSIQGVRVKTSATESGALSGLPSGVYIVNGKKHVVK